MLYSKETLFTKNNTIGKGYLYYAHEFNEHDETHPATTAHQLGRRHAKFCLL
jgi:hypothetical protein